MPHGWPSSLHQIVLEPDASERGCPHCGRRMWICDHRFRRIETLTGPAQVCCKLLRCPDRTCLSVGQTFAPQAEQWLAPPRLALDWDLFAWIGQRRFARHCSVPMICADLRASFKIDFSADAIEEYIHRYERMVAARHQDPVELRDVYANIPDLVLSIDGLQPEKGHQVLYVVREINAGRVWFAAPLLSSTAAEIEALFTRVRDIATALGKPVRAWVSDKQDAFLTGIAAVFPGVPHRLCKIHFVRALAKKTLADDGRTKVKMRKKVRGLRGIERKVLAALRPPTDAPVEPAASALASSPTTDEPRRNDTDHDVAALALASDAAPAPSSLTPPENVAPPSPHAGWTGLVLDYCAATRGILNDDQGTALEPPGVRMARALEEVKVSLDVCRDAKKGGPPRARSAH